LWWEGPAWLKLNKEVWPKDNIKIIDKSQEVSEEKQTTHLYITQKENSTIEKFSSFSKLLRIVSLYLRCKSNTLKCKHRTIGPIQADKLA